MPFTTIAFDMRVPDLGTSAPDIYAAALEMCEFVDGHLDYAWTMEHHGATDGYLPAPLTMAAAIAARTKKIRIVGGVILLPLHDPVHVAEQIAVVDLISNGRLDVAFGSGYVAREFAMFGRDIHKRGRALDEGVPIVQRALAGERFEVDGRPVFVRPLPVQQPFPIMMGGGVDAAARRAARLSAGLFPMTPSIVPIYKEECARLGREPGKILASITQLHVTEDPDRTWRQLEPHVLQFVRSYAEFTEGAAQSGSPYAGMNDLEAVKKSGVLEVLTPDEAVKLAEKADSLEAGVTLHPLLGGMPPKLGFESLQLFVDKVLPRIKRPAEATPQAAPAG